MSVAVGQEAPDFTLTNQSGDKVSLSDYRGKKNVVLMFYPFAFSGMCTTELCALRDRYVDFVNDDSVVLSVSCDSRHTLRAFAEAEGLTHSLLADFWPHGAVAQTYGAFLDELGFDTRATFVIDKDGIVRWSVVNGPGEARSADDYAQALADLA
ncbi:MAG: peroxiredoxin [Actinobacteria bacterium]|jgi:peroxiredoxin|nr:peroxiredoxin [Actinomycetota bacterium]